MDKPRIFLGSSGKQEKLLQALTRGLSDIARVEPWTTSRDIDSGTPPRTHARSRLRGICICARRLDDEPPGGLFSAFVGPGLSAR